MSKAEAALQHVHNLYLMQFKMLDLLQQDLTTPEARREARDNMKEFQQLLRKADWRYMGGEDVLDALRMLPSEMEMKLRTSTASVRAAIAGLSRGRARMMCPQKRDRRSARSRWIFMSRTITTSSRR